MEQYNTTITTPLGLGVLAVLCVLMLLVERRKVFIPLLCVVCLIPYAQRIVVAGADFDFLRIVLLVFVVRVAIRGDRLGSRLNALDASYVAWLIFSAAAYVALRGFTAGAIVNRAGNLFTGFASYFAIRMAIRDKRDTVYLIRVMLVLSAIPAFTMVIEQLTGINVFAYVGGVDLIATVREGRIRAQAALGHPILAGSYGAALLPLAWYIRAEPGGERWFRFGAVVSFVMTLATSSSGPILSLVATLAAILLFPYRRHLRDLLLLSLVGLLGLSMVMDAPVYALFARVTVIGASTGYHRFYLIDQTVRRVSEWWLFGVQSTAHWGWGLQDVTSMYVRVAVDGGLAALTMFTMAGVLSYRYTVLRPRKFRIVSEDTADDRLRWALACFMFSHMVSFLGVAYFSNMVFVYIIGMATISSLHQRARAEIAVRGVPKTPRDGRDADDPHRLRQRFQE